MTSAWARGYNGEHQRLRAALLAQLPMPCARCGKPILPGMLVDLDHTDDRTGWLGLSHRRCNRRAAAIKTNKARAAALRAAKGMTTPPSDQPKIQVDRRW